MAKTYYFMSDFNPKPMGKLMLGPDLQERFDKLMDDELNDLIYGK